MPDRRRYNASRRAGPPRSPLWYVLGADGRRALWTQDEGLAMTYAQEGYEVEGVLDRRRLGQ